MQDIEAQYKHSWIGRAMFRLCTAWTRFLIKHRWLYVLLSCTWGLIMTLIGFFCMVGLSIGWIFNRDIKIKPYYWEISMCCPPDSWGGMDCGPLFVRDLISCESVSWHEFGHSFQNCLLGPLFPFVVAIPSAIRWWARMLKPNGNFSEYDAVWFEDNASQAGRWARDYLKAKQNGSSNDTK